MEKIHEIVENNGEDDAGKLLGSSRDYLHSPLGNSKALFFKLEQLLKRGRDNESKKLWTIITDHFAL